MKYSENWYETKYHITNDGKVSAPQTYIGSPSWLFVNILSKQYEKCIPKYARGFLLDLGCGNVPLYGLYKKYIENNICIDWDNSLHKNPYLDLSHNIANGIPFNNEMFDTILLSDVLEHIPNPNDLFKEMVRTLKHEGRIIMSTPFLYWIHEQPFDYGRYTEFYYQKLADDNNLSIEYIEELGGGIEVLSDIFGKIINIIRCPKLFISIQQKTAYAFYKSKLGQKFYKHTKKNFTLGYFIVFRK